MLRARSFLLVLGTPFFVACSGDNFAPTPAGAAGTAGSAGALSGGAAGSAGTSTSGGASGAGNGGTGGGASGGAAGADAGNAGAGGADAGAGGADAGAGGTNAGAGGSQTAGAGGAQAGAGGSIAGSGGANAGAAGIGGTGGANGGAAGSSAGNGGAAGESGAAGQAGSGGSGPIVCPVLYVAPSPLGVDGPLRGCSPATPLASIDAALDRARERKLANEEITSIRVCAGTYAEKQTLRLDVGVSLEGSYGCTNGEFAEPTLDAIKTFVTVKEVPVLRITGNEVEQSTRVAHISFDGAGTFSAETNAAVIVEKGARPTLEACTLLAGEGTDSLIGSAGLLVRNGATAKVLRSTLRGGKGALVGNVTTPVEDASVGSAGVFIARDAGSVTLQGSTIDGGRGVAPGKALGSAGVALRGPELTITNGTITSGVGKLDGAAPKVDALAVRSAGLDIQRASADALAAVTVTGTTIRGGTAEGAEASRTVGVRARRASVTLARGRIYGGDAAKDTPTNDVFGVSAGLLGFESKVSADNTLIHGGGAQGGGNGSASASTSYTRATYFEKSTFEARLVTLLAGRGSGNAVSIQTYGVENTIQVSGSLLVAQTSSTFGVFAQNGCKGGTGPNTAPVAGTPVLDRVVFVQPVTSGTGHLYQGDGNCGYADAPGALPAQGFGVTSVTQVIAADGGGTEPADALPVAGCNSNEACPVAVFQGYDALDAGYAATLTGSGLAPRCTMPTEILRGANVPPGILEDLAGKARTSPTACGAFVSGCP